MAAKSSLLNMALCLTLVCAFCAAILGCVYAVTYEPIQDANANILNASIGEVLPEGGMISAEKTLSLDGKDYIYYEQTSADGVSAYAIKSTATGFGGPLELMVGVLPDGTVYNTSVISHSETPGLGAKCKTDEGFLGQFRGFSADKTLKLKKDGGELDAITASTITSRAYALAVENAVKAVMVLVKETEEE